MNVIPTVNVGERIKASHINQLVDGVNQLAVAMPDNYFSPNVWAPQTDNMPWYISPETPNVPSTAKRLHVQIGTKTVDASPYDGEAQGDKKSGDFYVVVKKTVIEGKEPGTGDVKVVHEDELEALTDYEAIKVYTLHPVVIDNQEGGPWTIEYHNTAPTFGGTSQAAEEYGAWRWDSSTHTFKYCHFQFGRAVYSLQDQSIEGPGTVYLNIQHDAPDGASVSLTPVDNTLQSTHVPLITIDKDNNITNDYRGMPVVPVWGSAST